MVQTFQRRRSKRWRPVRGRLDEIRKMGMYFYRQERLEQYRCLDHKQSLRFKESASHSWHFTRNLFENHNRILKMQKVGKGCPLTDFKLIENSYRVFHVHFAEYYSMKSCLKQWIRHCVEQEGPRQSMAPLWKEIELARTIEDVQA